MNDLAATRRQLVTDHDRACRSRRYDAERIAVARKALGDFDVEHPGVAFPRMGITKSKAGHHTIWCQGCSRTINLLPSAGTASGLLVKIKAAMGEGGDVDAKRRIFTAFADGSRY